MRKQIILLAITLISATFFAQKDELKTATKALDKGDYSTAISAIKALDAMETSMEDKYKAEYYFLKGKAYANTEFETAAASFNKLFDLEKQMGKAKFSDEAKPILEQIISKVSNKAIELYNNKDYDNATSDFYLTYKLSPRDTTFLYNAAISASLAKKYDKALEHYKKLLELGYTGITTYYFAVNKATNEKENMGSKGLQDAYIKAGTHNNPTVEVSPSKKPEIVKNISYIYIDLGDTEKAITAIKEARKADPKDLNLILNEAQLYIKLKDNAKFAELMNEAIKLSPNDPILYFNLGVINQNDNKVEEAINYYKKAIELKSDYGDAYLNLAIAILAGEQAIVDEMNKNLTNIKKYDELEKKQKELYKKALPYLEKADELGRSIDTVRTLLNIYDNLLLTEKADKFREVYKKMRE